VKWLWILNVSEILSDIQKATLKGDIVWKKHTLERMFEREISRNKVKQAILEGEVIENYPDDMPLPSVLICNLKPSPLHIVVAHE